MNRRRVNKGIAREARTQRRELVHAAGCTHDGCATKWYIKNPDWAKDPQMAPQRPVAVPRSIRPILGTHIGGAP